MVGANSQRALEKAFALPALKVQRPRSAETAVLKLAHALATAPVSGRNGVRGAPAQEREFAQRQTPKARVWVVETAVLRSVRAHATVSALGADGASGMCVKMKACALLVRHKTMFRPVAIVDPRHGLVTAPTHAIGISGVRGGPVAPKERVLQTPRRP